MSTCRRSRAEISRKFLHRRVTYKALCKVLSATAFEEDLHSEGLSAKSSYKSNYSYNEILFAFINPIASISKHLEDRPTLIKMVVLINVYSNREHLHFCDEKEINKFSNKESLETLQMLFLMMAERN